MSTTRKIRCTDCGEAVPYGRLSCPSCGTLLASVAGGVRHTASAAQATPDGDPVDGTDDLGAAAAAATAAMTARAVEGAPIATATAQTPAPTAAATVPIAPTPAAASAMSDDPPSLQPREPKRTAPRTPAQRTASSRTLVPTTVVRTMTAVLAPAASPATATASMGVVAAPAGAATWSGASSAPLSADDAADPDASQAATHPGFFDLDHLDLARVNAGLEWATAIGAGFVAVSLLLPWSRSVIGAGGVNSYFDSWGVAGPAHVLVLIWAIALVGAAIIPNPVPTWITRAVAPLTLGVFVLGLAWPYAIGPLGGQIGVVIAFMAGIVLVVTGLVGEWFTRHPSSQPPV